MKREFTDVSFKEIRAYMTALRKSWFADDRKPEHFKILTEEPADYIREWCAQFSRPKVTYRLGGETVDA